MKRRHILMGAGTLAVAGSGAAYLGMRQMGSMDDYHASVATARATLAEHPQMQDLVRYATLAANGHNTQPWRFRIEARRIEILPDFTRRTPAVDPDNHHLYASLGCAAENLSLAAAARARAGEISFSTAGAGAVVFAFNRAQSKPVAAVSPLFDAITRRQSTRAEFDGPSVSAAELNSLEAAGTMPGVNLILITARPQMERVRELVLAGNRTQMADAAFVRELKSWLRFSPRQAMSTGDGLFSATTGNPTLPAWLGHVMFERLFKVDAENEKYARQIQSSAGIAVFVSARDDPEHWVQAGRACQRFALQATALGLKHAFINQPVEVAGLRPELAALVGLPGRRPDIVMRFGHGPTLPFSARRPVAAVLA